MKSTKILSAAILAMGLSGCVVHVNAQRADVELEETLTLNSASLTQFDLDTGAGSLEVVGVSGLSEITVDAFIRTTEDKSYTLTLERNGSRAQLVAEHDSHSGYWQGSSPSIDLVVKVPDSLMINIDDGSGDLNVRGINNSVVIEDGSGSASVENVKGDIEIHDGSGGLVVKDVIGKVTIDDGSGEASIANITGDLTVEDGSGSLNIYNISGMVTLDDGSGSIDVNKAGGLNIIDAGSGGLKISNVSGSVNIDD